MKSSDSKSLKVQEWIIRFDGTIKKKVSFINEPETSTNRLHKET